MCSRLIRSAAIALMAPLIALNALGQAATIQFGEARVEVGLETSISLQTTDLTGLGAFGFAFTVEFDPAVIDVVAATVAGSLSSDRLIAFTLLSPGVFRVAVAGGYVFEGVGTLLTLQAVGVSVGDPMLSITDFTFDAPGLDVEADESLVTVVELNVAPTAAFTPSSLAGQAPVEITFDASASSDANEDPLTFAWTFGDGGTGTGPVVTHTFTSAGDFVVTVEVSDGRLSHTATVTVNIASGVGAEDDSVPAEFRLEPAYPNPFNPSTVIGYALPVASDVRVIVTDLLGRTVEVLQDNRSVPAGMHTVRFEAGSRPSGIYLVRMEAGPFVEVHSIALVR